MTRYLVCVGIVLALFVCRPASAQTSRRVAILIGVGEYEKMRRLNHAERDAEVCAAELDKVGFTTKVLTTRVGKNDASRLPTRRNIEHYLKDWLKAQNLTATDLVVLGLSGHGVQLAGKPDAYFCPIEADSRVHPDTKEFEHPETLFSMAELLKILNESGAGMKLVLVDACRNDPSSKKDSGDVAAAGVFNAKKIVDQLNNNIGVLFSCKEGQVSWEDASWGEGHGALFHEVIRAMRGQGRDGMGRLTWNSLTQHVIENVPRLVGRTQGMSESDWSGPKGQTPQVYGVMSVVPELAPSHAARIVVAIDYSSVADREARQLAANVRQFYREFMASPLNDKLKEGLVIELVGAGRTVRLAPEWLRSMADPEEDSLPLTRDAVIEATTKGNKYFPEAPPPHNDDSLRGLQERLTHYGTTPGTQMVFMYKRVNSSSAKNNVNVDPKLCDQLNLHVFQIGPNSFRELKSMVKDRVYEGTYWPAKLPSTLVESWQNLGVRESP